MPKVEVNPPTPNLIIGIACLFSFLAEGILSQMFLEDVYLFEWTSRHGYWFIWVGIVFSTAKRKPVLSVSIAAGNLLALILGYLFARIDQFIKATQITPDMSPADIAYLLRPMDWRYWINLVLLFTIIGAALQHKYTVDGYPAWMRKLNARMKRRIEKIWNAITRLFPG